MKRRNSLISLALFVLGFVAATSWQSLKANFYFRPVQYLDSRDHSQHAVLERNDGWMDLNFRVKLNGKVIYLSPDFSPNRTIAYRETLLWDDTGSVLILEIAERRLFGFNLAQQRKLTDGELLGAKVSSLPLRRYDFEGRWPSDNIGPASARQLNTK